MSGYVPCACRDCMDVAITGDDDAPALCLLCKDAGCLVWHPGYDYGAYDCQREDAYES